MKKIITILFLSLNVNSNYIFSINRRNLICNELIEDFSINGTSGEVNSLKINHLISNLMKIIEPTNIKLNIYFVKFSLKNICKILKIKDLLYIGGSLHLDLKSFSIGSYFLYKNFRIEILLLKENEYFLLLLTGEYLYRSNWSFKLISKKLKIANVNEIIYFNKYKRYKNSKKPEKNQSQEEKDKILLETLNNLKKTDENIQKFNEIKTTLNDFNENLEYFESFNHVWISNEILRYGNTHNITKIHKDLQSHIKLLQKNFSSIYIPLTNKENDINPNNWWFKLFW